MSPASFNGSGVQYLITELGEELGLTDEQKNQLIALQVEHRNERRAVNRTTMSERRNRQFGRQAPARQKGRGNYANIRQARAQERAEMHEDVFEILSDDQVDLLQSKLTERAEKAHQIVFFNCFLKITSCNHIKFKNISDPALFIIKTMLAGQS